MKNKHLMVAVGILSIIAILSSIGEDNTFFKDNKNINLTIKDNDTNQETLIDLEEYIIGVVAGEMPASFASEALKAQAIAARTYAIYKQNTKTTTYDLTTDVSNQVYITPSQMKENWGNEYEYYYNKIKNCVEETEGLVMEYEGEIISSYYFAMSNGKTEDASLVFGESKDYLISVDSSWDEEIKNYEVTTEFTIDDFCTKLNISSANINIKDITRTPSGRVNYITINNQVFKGTEVREKLGLRSTDFTIEVADTIKVTTRGYGHGVGMSQYGANTLAKSGKTYEEILKYYYQNIDIVKINV